MTFSKNQSRVIIHKNMNKQETKLPAIMPSYSLHKDAVDSGYQSDQSSPKILYGVNNTQLVPTNM